ncbi:ferritin-like domain-containing protein [Streptomyces gamaensis]|uniref:Ferritin-like domain-containing protein n=1 Tax=Streptomyces gamaensis TaxID=1763542 RepID=A0ABW0YS83_9ACTN
MSVFDLPRLHFAGTATTRLPTGPRSGRFDLASGRALGGDGLPFPPERPASEYHAYLYELGPRFGADGLPCPDGAFSLAQGWNFGGNGHFRLDARVVCAEGPDGRATAGDPVLGRAVDVWGHYNPYLRTTVNRARVFDLDPASRWTTALMVGQFGLGRAGRSHDGGYMLLGDVEGCHPPRWVDFRRILDVGEHVLAPQLRYGAVHQFVVDKGAGRWLPDAGLSPAVGALRAAVDGGADGLVVQLALDNMASPRVPDAPDVWRVRGTVAPWHAHEPRSCPAGRLLVPTGRRLPARAGGDGEVPAAGPPLHHLTVRLAQGTAVFNLVTAVPLTHRAEHPGPGPLHRLGPPLDAGDLELRTAGSGRLLARLPSGAYPGDATSGIVTVPAAPGACEAAEDEALCLTAAGREGRPVPLLTEREVRVDSDEALLFVHPPDRARGRDHAVRVPLRSYVHGRPAGATVRVRQYANPRALPADPRAGAPGARCGDAVVLDVRGQDGGYAEECVVRTDEAGHGVLTVRGRRAGSCRVLLGTGPQDVPPVDEDAPGSAWAAYDDADALGHWAGVGTLHARVLPDDWHLDEVPRQDVDFELLHREVFAPYEQLSSFMRSEVFSLADSCKVRTYAELIWQMCDPRNRDRTYHMPSTRDLTEPKARLLLAYLRNCQARVRPPLPVPAVPVTDPVITTRAQLWSALRQAAALELAVMLQYLYAAFSVPTYGAGLAYVRQGLWTERQLALACGGGGAGRDDGIRGALLAVAREEMVHFLLVNNIIMAMGEAFCVPVVDFPAIGGELPVPVDFALEPLSAGSVQRFVAIEQPAALVPALRREGEEGPAADTRGESFVWRSASELYAGIREGIQRVPELFLVERGRGGGEHHLFLRESVNSRHPDYQLEVDDVSSALFAVDLITEQGEGGRLAPEAPERDEGAEVSHFRTFLRIGEQLTAEHAPGPYGRQLPWSPAYPVLRNPTLRGEDGAKDAITDPGARAVARLCDRSYYLSLQLMAQHFGEGADTSLRRSKLMNASIDVMTGMLRPLAEVLVTLDSGRRGRTAGPPFELEAAPCCVPRPDVARRSLALRFAHQARAARACGHVPGHVADLMEYYAGYFRRAEGV